MTLKNLTMTFDDGRIMTCRFPAFSALLMAFKQSFYIPAISLLFHTFGLNVFDAYRILRTRTEVLTILTVVEDLRRRNKV